MLNISDAIVRNTDDSSKTLCYFVCYNIWVYSKGFLLCIGVALSPVTVRESVKVNFQKSSGSRGLHIIWNEQL